MDNQIRLVPNPQNLGMNFLAQIDGGINDGKYLGEYQYSYLINPDPRPFMEWMREMRGLAGIKNRENKQ